MSIEPTEPDGVMTDPLTLRLFPHEDADGPTNMALDEALLDLVTGDPRASAFRTYGWSEPTLSLGYFQAIADAESEPRWRGVPLVRRPTGGGAIWHDRELTYVLAVPAGHPLARRSGELYRAVHATIASLFAGFGVEARRRGESDAPAGTARRPFLCFNDRDPNDLVAGRVKVAGSAQRRRAGAVLQHGSILLAGSARTPELIGAADLASVPFEPERWSELLRRGLPESLGLLPRDDEWPQSVRTRADELVRSVYRNPAWTLRR
jgi:lipoate-protein ligase A